MHQLLEQLLSDLSPIREGNFEYHEFAGKYDVSVNKIDPLAVVPTHTHDIEVYNFVIDGVVEFDIAGERKKYSKGDWINIKAHVEHSLYNSNSLLCLLEFWKKK